MGQPLTLNPTSEENDETFTREDDEVMSGPGC